MSLATVTETLELPAGVKPRQVKVRLRLIATNDGSDAAGYSTADNATVGGVHYTRPDGDGVYTFTNVRPNAAGADASIDTPSGTTYELVVTYPDGRNFTRYISVPTSGGTHRVEDILSAAPSALEDPGSTAALTAHTASTTAHDAADITYTGAVAGASTVEEGLDTLESAKATTGYVDDSITTISTLLQAGYNALTHLDTFEPESAFRYLDDMIGGTSSTMPDGWLLSAAGTGAGAADVSANEGLPGVKALETGSTSTGSSFATLDSARMPGDTIGSMWARVRLAVVDGDPGVEDWTAYVGLFEGLGTAGAFFTASPGTTNWQATTYDGAATTTDTGVAIAGGSWRWLKVERTASSVVFSIDGSVVATHTTNLPTSGDQVRPTLWMLKSVGTTNRRMQIDVVACDYEFSRGAMG